MTKLQLGFVELYWPKIHGNVQTDQQTIYNHYLLTERFTPNNFTKSKFREKTIEFHKKHYQPYFTMQNNTFPISMTDPHPHIRNFETIISNTNYFQFHLVQVLTLHDAYVCIVKTHYIRWIQRAWRNLISRRNHIISQRKNPTNLIYRSIHNRWPESCINLPSYKGILVKS